MVMSKVEKKKVSKAKSNKDFPPGMAPKMLNMLQVVEELESAINPLVSKPHHEILAKMSPLEKSKMGMLEAYTINSLFWVMMKTSKEAVDSTLREDYKIEMGRLKEVQARIAEVEARANRPQVNPEVASRLISRGIGKSAKKKQNQEGKDGKRLKVESKPDNCESQKYKSAWQ